MTNTSRIWRANLLALTAALFLGGCSTTPVLEGDQVIEPVFSADRVLEKDIEYAVDLADPWEGLNRSIYRFNYRFDKYVFLPAVTAYQAVTPDIVEQGLHNFFSNFNEVTTLINSILQLNPQKSVETASRMAWNTTLGLLGFIDVATGLMDIPKHQEDFGQTLGYWGVGPGPYLVLPIMGPSSLRDGIGFGVDWFARSGIRDGITDLEEWHYWTWTILNAIDLRANVPFRYYETGSAFEYDMVRWLSSSKRRLDIAK